MGCDGQVTDDNGSSGMCKAGFAGDDAPRAVFRKFIQHVRIPQPQLTAAKHLSSADLAIMGKAHQFELIGGGSLTRA